MHRIRFNSRNDAVSVARVMANMRCHKDSISLLHLGASNASSFIGKTIQSKSIPFIAPLMSDEI
jgi:hypothetical protein